MQVMSPRVVRRRTHSGPPNCIGHAHARTGWTNLLRASLHILWVLSWWVGAGFRISNTYKVESTTWPLQFTHNETEKMRKTKVCIQFYIFKCYQIWYRFSNRWWSDYFIWCSGNHVSSSTTDYSAWRSGSIRVAYNGRESAVVLTCVLVDSTGAAYVCREP